MSVFLLSLLIFVAFFVQALIVQFVTLFALRALMPLLAPSFFRASSVCATVVFQLLLAGWFFRRSKKSLRRDLFVGA